MRALSEFPYRVREIENTWIELSDGARLGARLWLPEGAEERPVPAVLEYLPYRKDDATAWQDSTRHRYFAGCGYASVRVDIRGTGDSDGILLDEYLPQEQDDALEVLAWIAAQEWCSGEVGMIGYSWGGFNGLQVAARRPPELKAVVSLCSTDDRYLDDCHYSGGCILAADMLKWAESMRVITALPPDPRFVGERWREMWLERLQRTPHYAEAWLSHQRRDEFWKQGSVAEDYAAIQCPVFLVGGWADAYTNAIPRLLEDLECPRNALIGPWGHMFPERGVPEPAIGFLQECVLWWDRWLKGADNEVTAWPALRVWMQEPVSPAASYSERPGRWLAEDRWPPGTVGAREFALTVDGGLLDVLGEGSDAEPARSEEWVELLGSEACGATAGVWCANGMADEMAGDQQTDDALSLRFDSAPLSERLEILGFPEVTLSLEVDRPHALVAVRLCDVAPEGTSALVTWGQLNLTHRDSHEHPALLEPGRRYVVRVRLNAVAQAIEQGHRLRVAVSPTYWPMAWPSPERVTLRVLPSDSRLALPVRGNREGDGASVAFSDAETATPIELDPPARDSRTRHRKALGGRYVIEDREVRSAGLVATATLLSQTHVDEWSIAEDDPLSARVACARDFTIEREGWSIRVVASAEMTCDEVSFVVTDDLEAYQDGTSIYRKTQRFTVPRDL